MIQDGQATAQELEDARRLVQEVMAEVRVEARQRRQGSGISQRELDQLDEIFSRHAPFGSERQRLADALRTVDARCFVDPVVPIDSRKAGGAAVKRGIRSATLWYVGYVAHQVSQFATAVSRALHLVERELEDLRRIAERVVPGPTLVLDAAGNHRVDAWWVGTALEALQGVPGRVLHGGCGDGWLVGRLMDAGIDAYGVDPRVEERVGALDLRAEDLVAHLDAVAGGSLGGLVLTGVLDGLRQPDRDRVLRSALAALADGGVLVVHSATPTAWDRPEAPGEVDLAPGRPLRAVGWRAWCRALGLPAEVLEGPEGMDLLVLAHPAGEQPAP